MRTVKSLLIKLYLQCKYTNIRGDILKPKKKKSNRKLNNKAKLIIIVSSTLLLAFIGVKILTIKQPVESLDNASNEVEYIEDVVPGVTDQEATDVDTSLVYAELEKVVDGDTLWVKLDGEDQKVRLLEIDTPESVHSDESKNNEYGQMASDYTKNLLSGVTGLYLEYGEEKNDQYGRLLAYVWLSNKVDVSNKDDQLEYMVNAKIVADGYARVTSYSPNKKNEWTFTTLMTEAQDNRVGLWQYDEYWNIAGYELPEVEETTETEETEEAETEVEE